MEHFPRIGRSFTTKVSTAMLTLAFGTLLAPGGSAQKALADPGWGTAAENAPSARAAIALGALSPRVVYSYARVASGGVGLRNRAAGAINISGVTGAVKAALLYWAVITDGAPTAANASVIIRRLLPTPAGPRTIIGTAVGSGDVPCWAYGNTTTVFRGAVPLSLANGNGVYLITLQPGASGLTGGQDPFAGQVLPMMEGASLVIVGTDTVASKVAIYDRNLAGKTFNAGLGLSYTLLFPINFGTASAITLVNIGADGQKGGSSTLAGAVASQEKTTINGIAVAGPTSAANDSDWNGNIADPSPQLWDNTDRDVTTAAKADAIDTKLRVEITAPSSIGADCLVPAVNVVTSR